MTALRNIVDGEPEVYSRVTLTQKDGLWRSILKVVNPAGGGWLCTGPTAQSKDEAIVGLFHTLAHLKDKRSAKP